MAEAPNIKLQVEIEPIVILKCLNLDCKHNLVNFVGVNKARCNLKFVEITQGGQCYFKEYDVEKD